MFFFTHTVATRVRVLFLVCFVTFFLMCVCGVINAMTLFFIIY